MIKITRTVKPHKLAETESELTNAYKLDNTKTVWNKKYIKEALFEMSHGKCCYCEVKLGEEGKYMQVEHFHNKSKYPDEVVKWENLLPSCNRCNITKSDYDTYENEIINPCIDNPKDYLYMKNYRYKSKEYNTKGMNTIDVLYLNDSDNLVKPRFAIGEEIQNKISELLGKMNTYINSKEQSVINKNKIVFGIRDLLKLAQPTEEYSATAATIIMGENDYKVLKEKMKSNGLWNNELNSLDSYAEKINLNL